MGNCSSQFVRSLTIAAGLLFSPALLLAQNASGVPDLSGNWNIAPGGPSWDPNDAAGIKPDELPMTPTGDGTIQGCKSPFGAKQTFDSPTDPVQKYCDSPGATRLYEYPWQFTIVQTPAHVYLLFEYFHEWRQITMNQPHVKDPTPTWLGDSVGKYEGDSLVIDTIGFNDESWLDNVGHPHSDALHTIERIHHLSNDVLELELTIDDPKAYTKSFTSKKTFKRSSFPMSETMCSLSENGAFQKDIMDRTVSSPKPAK